jgi:hypothetical protein
MLEKNLIDDSTLPITNYDYSAIKDRLAKQGIVVSLSTLYLRLFTGQKASVVISLIQ